MSDKGSNGTASESEKARERMRSHTDSGYVKVTTPAPALDKVATAVAIGEALIPIEREKARERYEQTRPGVGEKVTPTDKGKALDKVASAVGMSRPLTTARRCCSMGIEIPPRC